MCVITSAEKERWPRGRERNEMTGCSKLPSNRGKRRAESINTSTGSCENNLLIKENTNTQVKYTRSVMMKQKPNSDQIKWELRGYCVTLRKHAPNNRRTTALSPSLVNEEEGWLMDQGVRPVPGPLVHLEITLCGIRQPQVLLSALPVRDTGDLKTQLPESRLKGR